MTAEIKPGKWRLADGREVVVFADSGPYGWLSWIKDDNDLYILKAEKFEGASYLGPAVIGEAPMNGRAYWILRFDQADRQCKELQQQCKELEAETVATRELLEKAEERCEELAKELAESDEAFRRRALLAPNSGDPPPYWLSGVSCEVEGDLVIHRYKSVTVMVRGEREATAVQNSTSLSWYGKYDTELTRHMEREDAEAWCREQLEPRWREAGEGDVGKACRVKDLKSDDWEPCERLYAVIDHEFQFLAGDPDDPGTIPTLYAFCEVQD